MSLKVEDTRRRTHIAPVSTASPGQNVIDQVEAVARPLTPATNGSSLEAGSDPVKADTGQLVVRALRPDASRVAAVFGDRRHDLSRVHPAGVFAGVVPGPAGDYQLEVAYPVEGGAEETHLVDDAYR